MVLGLSGVNVGGPKEVFLCSDESLSKSEVIEEDSWLVREESFQSADLSWSIDVTIGFSLLLKFGFFNL